MYITILQLLRRKGLHRIWWDYWYLIGTDKHKATNQA